MKEIVDKKTTRFFLLMGLLFLLQPVSGQERNIIDWNEIKNPFYPYTGKSNKDACMIYNEKNSTFYLFFSSFYWDEGRERCHVTGVKTKDFKEFSEPLFTWDGKEHGWIGLASPDIVRIDSTYYLTYNSWGDKEGKPNQLFYAKSTDLERWEKDFPLASNLTEGLRAIDAALAFDKGRYVLVWKKGQTPQIAYADYLDSKEWVSLGRPAKSWFENGQLIQIDGKWNLLQTSSDHFPKISKMLGGGEKAEDWTAWGEPLSIDVPEQTFNTNEKANAGFLADWRKYDGYFYLLYAGRTEGITHKRRGNNSLALARSKDLIQWSVPAESALPVTGNRTLAHREEFDTETFEDGAWKFSAASSARKWRGACLLTFRKDSISGETVRGEISQVSPWMIKGSYWETRIRVPEDTAITLLFSFKSSQDPAQEFLISVTTGKVCAKYSEKILSSVAFDADGDFVKIGLEEKKGELSLYVGDKKVSTFDDHGKVFKSQVEISAKVSAVSSTLIDKIKESKYPISAEIDYLRVYRKN